MPAEMLQSYQQQQQHPRDSTDAGASVSPDPQRVGFADDGFQDDHMHSLPDTHREHHESETGHLDRPYGPPPADFTMYYPQPPTGGSTPAPEPYLPSPAEQSTRKRSLSISEEQHDRLHDTGQGEKSLLDLAQRASLEAAIDPSLSGAPASGSEEAKQAKAKKREELNKQAERLRAMLMAAESELARIEGEEREQG